MNTTKRKQRSPGPQDYAKSYLSARLEDLTLPAASIDLRRKRASSWQLSKAAARSAVRINEDVLLRQGTTTRRELDQTRHASSRIAIGSYCLCEC